MADSGGQPSRKASICGNGPQRWQMHGDEQPIFAEYLRLAWDKNWSELVHVDSLDIQPTDALIVVDMQNDFIPIDHMNPKGGAFAVAEGGGIASLVAQHMQRFGEAGALVVATRDYHPVDHCSFLGQCGHFPAHCIQGSVGSHFYETIGDCIRDLESKGQRTQVVFKGFHEDVDSFGSFEYPDDPTSFQRVTCRDEPARLHGCTLAAWTGSVVLKCSNYQSDVNAPPDVCASYSRVNLADFLKEQGIRRVFACGLALDFCVLDTTLNGVKAGFSEMYMILDAARAAYLPGIGSFGSGFLQDPADLQAKMSSGGVKLVPSVALLPNLKLKDVFAGQEAIRSAFPAHLGPFALVPAKRIELDFSKPGMYIALKPEKDLRILAHHGISPCGTAFPCHKITLDADARELCGIPESATHFLWAAPLGLGSMDERARLYFSITTPTAAFLAYGGFVYLDANKKVVAVMALSLGSGLTFEDPQPLRDGYRHNLSKRWMPVTISFLRKQDARHFAWVNPREQLEHENGGDPWVMAEHGAFVYSFNEDPAVPHERDRFFQVAASEATASLPFGSVSHSENNDYAYVGVGLRRESRASAA